MKGKVYENKRFTKVYGPQKNDNERLSKIHDWRKDFKWEVLKIASVIEKDEMERPQNVLAVKKGWKWTVPECIDGQKEMKVYGSKWEYTGVWFLVHRGGIHVTPCACRRSFGPLTLSNKNNFDGPKFRIRSNLKSLDPKLFKFAILVHQNYSNWIKSVDQNCDGMHMESLDYLLYGPKIIPPCI